MEMMTMRRRTGPLIILDCDLLIIDDLGNGADQYLYGVADVLLCE